MPVPPPPRRAIVIVTSVALAVAVVLGVVAHRSAPSAAELDFSRWLMNGPDPVARPLWLIMQFGATVAGAIAAAVIMGLLRGRRGALAALVTAFVAWLVARLTKTVVDRGRPADYLAEVNHRFEPLLRGHGYPSGHACVAFALAALIGGSVDGAWRVLPWLAATLVAFGRLYFGAHLPLDVVGGAALGVAVGLTTRWLFTLDARSAGPAAPVVSA
jgi:membrane-associated phospholipid phosphatase